MREFADEGRGVEYVAPQRIASLHLQYKSTTNPAMAGQDTKKNFILGSYRIDVRRDSKRVFKSEFGVDLKWNPNLGAFVSWW